MTARVWKFGDDINTDLIIPGKYLDSYDPAHLAAHAMEGVSRDFPNAVSKGDIIVAGSNFGCGSSREQAVIALKHAGVAAIVAKSFARIFYRNSINLGLLVLISSDAFDILEDGEEVVLDERVLSSRDRTKEATIEPVPEHLRKILEQGGLVPFISTRLNKDKT